MYTETPQNFAQLQEWITCDKAVFSHCLSTNKPIFLYDACAFIKHAQFSHPEPLFLYLKQKNALVVITRCILMELTSSDGCLQAKHTLYFQKLHQSGVSVAILYEEDLFSILEQCFSSSGVLNQYLSLAVKHTKSSVSTVFSTINNDEKLRQVLVRNHTDEHSVYRYFFQTVRKNKESQDNLGEELLTICVHALSNLPNCQKYQFLILTEDKDAIRNIERALANSQQHLNRTCFTVMSSSRLIQHLYSGKLITTQSQIEELLSAGNAANSLIKIYASGRYDLSPKELTLTASELAQKIVSPEAIHIYY